MSLTKGTIWARNKFSKTSRPTKETVIAWINLGDVPGRVLSGEPYVDEEKFDLSVTIPPTNNVSRISGIDLLVG